MRYLRRDGVLSVRQLTSLLGVSHMTVRRDIATLEREGRAHTIPGGVRLASHLAHEPTFATKAERDTREKVAIAAMAARLLHDDMVVYLDAGTTTGALVPGICEHRRITVITNDFAIVTRLAGTEGIEILHTGGRVEAENRSTVGRLAAETIRRLNSDVAFISASSWDLQRGVTTPSEPKVGVKIAAIDTAATAVLVATSSKFGTYGLYDIAPLTRFDHIVTDSHLPLAAAQGIRDAGVDLQLAP